LQEVREAPAGEEQPLSRLQAVTVDAPSAHETPVTRTSPLAAAETPVQRRALTPVGACGVVEVLAGGAVVPGAPTV
jgi:hypothetical protein